MIMYVIVGKNKVIVCHLYVFEVINVGSHVVVKAVLVSTLLSLNL